MYEIAPEAVWRPRYRHLRDFERMLVDEGTTVLKVFLNVSREEQRVRFQERIDDPGKRWKFRRDDLEVRRRFDEWIAAWDEALTETSTDWAPWGAGPTPTTSTSLWTPCPGAPPCSGPWSLTCWRTRRTPSR